MDNHHVSEELTEWEQIESPSVFPPGNHQDLPVSNAQHLEESESFHPPSPSDGGGGGGGDGERRWIRLHLGAVQSEIFRFFGMVRKYITWKVGLWSIAWMWGGIVAVLVVSVLRRRILMWWRRRMQLDLESSKESLMNLLREKDKKINQLLLQIAQMSEILLARRRVPVIRVK